ncbi:unnamed protein product [Tetraodon nigroviridis]|uniref:(spotted green pufferfish) hypothetical protein n=1 Tax=Tetraodon nigroviridis TaxID=99883 RepID=Q4S016_TETNG|nr:unnamed protein product [Tetraodon nigroviridis]
MSADDVIRAHEKALKEGTDRARSLAQTLLNVPYGEGDGEKLDVYIPSTCSLGTNVTVPTSTLSPLTITNQFSSFADINLVIYLHGGYWQFLRYRFELYLHVCTHSKAASGFFTLMICV